MKKLFGFFSLTNVAIIVFAILTSCATYVYAVVFIKSQHMQDYFIGIAASCFAIVPTVVCVNYLSDLRWESARSASTDALNTLVDQHVREIVIAWGHMSGAGDEDQRTLVLTAAHRKKYFRVIAAKLIENDDKSSIHGFGPWEWQTVKKSVTHLLPLVPRFLSLHRTTIHPEDYGRLLDLQSKLEKLNYALSFEDGALTTPLNEWEKTRHFAEPKYAYAARTKISKDASQILYEYLKTLVKFKP